MEFKDYYDVLGVKKAATPDQIKKAFRKLARQHHPDVNPGDHTAEAKFKALNEAHEVLGDPEKRRKYDQLGANWKQYENMPTGSGGPFGGGRPAPGGDVRWSVNVGGEPGTRTMSEEQVREMFGDNPSSDFFQTFFGGGDRAAKHPPRGARSRRGRDVEHTLELSLEQVFHGVTKRLSIPSASGGPARSVEVRIPAGAIDGSRVRVTGEGEPGPAGSAGDLYLRVRLAPHPVFECEGQNLYVNTMVSLPTAVLGGQVNVPAVDGKALRLKLPPSTQPGQVFRLKGRGMPGHGRRTTRGELYATVQITVPDRLSPEARKHYEALATLESSESGSHGDSRAKRKHSAV